MLMIIEKKSRTPTGFFAFVSFREVIMICSHVGFFACKINPHEMHHNCYAYAYQGRGVFRNQSNISDAAFLRK